MNLLQDADEASLPAILNCMHFLCDNDPAAQVTSACAATATAFPRAGVANRLLHTERVTPVAQTLLSRFGAPRLLAAHLLRSGMQVTRREWLLLVRVLLLLQVRVLLVSLLRTSLSAIIN